MPAIPGLKKCFFFVNLATGVLVIGYFELVGIILAGLFFLIMLFLATLKAGKPDEPNMMPLELLVVCLMMLGILFLFFILTSMLITGVNNERPLYVLIYAIAASAFLLLSVLPLMIGGWCMTEEMIILYIFLFLLDVYLLLIVWSYWLETMYPSEETEDGDEEGDEEEGDDEKQGDEKAGDCPSRKKPVCPKRHDAHPGGDESDSVLDSSDESQSSQSTTDSEHETSSCPKHCLCP